MAKRKDKTLIVFARRNRDSVEVVALSAYSELIERDWNKISIIYPWRLSAEKKREIERTWKRKRHFQR